MKQVPDLTPLKHPGSRLFLACSTISVVILIRLVWFPFLENSAPFLLFFPAILLIFWFAGSWAAVLGLFLSSFSVFTLSAVNAGAPVERPNMFLLHAMFIFAGLFMIWICQKGRQTAAFTLQNLYRIEKSEKRFRAIYEAGFVAVFFAHLNGRIFQPNSALIHLLGYSLEDYETGGVSWKNITPDEWKEQDERVNRELIEHGFSAPYEKQFRKKNGTLVDVQLSVLMVGTEEAVVFVQDITARKAAERAAAQAHEKERTQAARLAAVLDVVPAVVWVALDRECQFITGNAEAEKTLGLPRNVNHSLSDLETSASRKLKIKMQGEEVIPSALPIQRAAREGVALYGQELEVIRGDGTCRYLYGAAVPLLQNGIVTGSVGAFLDITKERDNRKMFEEQGHKLHLALDAGRFGTLEYQDKGRIYCDARFRVHLGFEGWEPVTLKNILRRLASKDRVILIGQIRSAESGGGDFELECEVCLPSGSCRWILARGTIHRTNNQYQVFCVTLDVTPQRRDQEALRQQAELLQAIVDQVPAFICYYDHLSGLEVVNKTARKWLTIMDGGTRDRSVFILRTHPLNQYLTKALAGETMVRDLEIETAEATTKPVNFSLTPYINATGNVQGVVVHGFDLTQIREQEAQIRKSAWRFHCLTQASSAIVWEADEFGRMIALTGWAEFTGTIDLDGLGRKWLTFVHKDDRERVEKTFVEAISECRLFHIEFQIRSSLRHYRHVEMRGVPVVDSGGTVSEWVGTVTDIHERKLRRTILENQKVELEKRVEERTAKLAETNKELEAFAYSISHDIRAPLRTLGTFTQSVLEDHENHLTADSHDMLIRVQKLVERVDSFTVGLLAYSKLSIAEIHLERVDLNSVAADVARYLADEIVRTGAILQIAPDMPDVTAEHAALTQAILNLVNNALKFVPPGNVPRVEISARHVGSQVEIEVRDNGIGIPLEYRNKVFGLFERLHGSSKYSGSGIGLALVKRAMDRMAGSVRILDVDTGGSLFVLSLKAASN